MSLDPERLKGKILTLMTEMLTREETSIDEFSERLSNAVIDEVKEATIIYQTGLNAPNGPVTGTFNGNLE